MTADAQTLDGAVSRAKPPPAVRRDSDGYGHFGRIHWLERPAPVDPRHGEVELHVTPQRLDPHSADWIERQAARDERHLGVLRVPLPAFDPARLEEIEAVAVAYALALSIRDEQLEREREKRDEFFDRLGDPFGRRFIVGTNRHKGVWLLTPDGGDAYIDRGLAVSMQRLWRDGVRTAHSCEGHARRGGLYLSGPGKMPEALASALAGSGLSHQQHPSRWTFWDIGPAHARPEFHRAARRLMDDIAAGGLAGVDASGQRYVPQLAPVPSLSKVLAAARRRIDKRRAILGATPATDPCAGA